MRRSPLDTLPERRALRIYAIDPMLARAGDLRVAVEVPYRRIVRSEWSFHDDRLEVIDYDSAAKRYYKAIDLDDSRIAMQQGVEPSESDPQFHQQMVYAVASRVLENFDRALGRRLRFWGGRRLRLFPHCFQGRNAYYDDKLTAVLFGYFPADESDPGENLPEQLIFTALSHDIIAHEVTHAALDRLRPYYREPTSPHVPALHEAFADVVAIFQRFTFTGVVREVVRTTRGDLLGSPNPFLDIGAQFGAASGRGAALRSIARKPDPSAFSRSHEPHELGLILVAAIYRGFVRTYEGRVGDLIRIATGGSGRLPDGELHPDLVNRLAAECARTAQAVLTMCIRATDYLPPVDPTFSDFLRAMVTADFELNRNDEIGLRAAMIESFRVSGIRPESVGSLAVESLLLEERRGPKDPELAGIVERLLGVGAREMSRSTRYEEKEPGAPEAPAGDRRPGYEKKLDKLRSPNDWIAEQQSSLAVPEGPETNEDTNEDDEPDVEWRDCANKLASWARRHRDVLGLDDRKIRLAGFHPVHRSAPGGELLVEMVAQFVQSGRTSDELGGLTYQPGLTMVATLEGRIRYLIPKPFQGEREGAMRQWVAEFDARRGPAWPTGPRAADRIRQAYSARALDARR